MSLCRSAGSGVQMDCDAFLFFEVRVDFEDVLSREVCLSSYRVPTMRFPSSGRRRYTVKLKLATAPVLVREADHIDDAYNL